jgi:syndecan 4
VNAAPSIFLSDRELLDTSISGTWLVTEGGDDDFIGFVFAYQNPGQFYLFDWKGGTQDDSSVGHAERGMAVKIVDIPCSGKLEAGKPFDGKDLWHTEGVQGKVKLLHHEPTEGWAPNKPYQFRLDFHPGNFRIVVKDGERVLYDKTFQDQTHKGGRFGFYNFSQGGVVYKGFTTVRLPGPTGHSFRVVLLIFIPLLLVLILIAIMLFHRADKPSRTGAAPEEPARLEEGGKQEQGQ